MEQNPFRQTEDAGDGSSNGKKSDGFSYAPNQRPDMTPRSERPIARAPIEGIISWRVPGEDIFRQGSEADAPKSPDSDKDGKDGNKKSSKSTNKPVALQPQARKISEVPPIAEAVLASPEEVADDADGEYEDDAEIFDGIKINPDFPLEPTVRPDLADAPVYEAPNPNTYTQHTYEQGDDDQIVTRSVAAAGASAQPPLPPINTQQSAVYNRAPQPSQYYVNQYMQSGEYSTQPNVASSPPDIAPAMPIEHPRHAANYDPRLAPVAATLGLGLLAEHIGRKRGDRRVEKHMNDQMDRLTDKQEGMYAKSQQALQERQRQFAAEQERQTAEMQNIRRAQERLAASPPPLSEQYYKPVDSSEASPLHGPNEHPKQYTEQRLAQVFAKEATPDIQTAERPTEARQRQHVEHSSWHNIVVDNRGHEVAGAIQYGESFKQERQPEAMQHVGSGAGSNSGAAAGSSSVQYKQRHFGGPVYPGALPSGMTTPALSQGKPTHIDPHHQLQASETHQSNVSNPWFWVMLALVIVAFFTAMII